MQRQTADTEANVAPLYQDAAVAESYIQKRFSYSWQRLLHLRQIAAVQEVLSRTRAARILELAPGPARIAVDLAGVREGTMVEFSREMIEVAQKRLSDKGLLSNWKILNGNAFDLSGVPGEFDFVYTFRFIRHFQPQDRERLYGQIAGKLRVGGILMFDIVNRPLRERLDARAQAASDALPVYDALFTETEFRSEMSRNGFEVETMAPVLRWFPLQSWLSGKLDDVAPVISSGLVNGMEKLPSQNPLEWIAVCRKIRG